VGQIIAENVAGFGKYPPNDGTPELCAAISGWIGRRYGVSVDPGTQVMTLNGTREGLFNAALALCPETVRGKRPVVLMPNPFYQVYAVAALAVGAGVSTRLRRAGRGCAEPRGDCLSVLALQPAGGRGDGGVLARPDRAGRKA
jgi:aspartate/methionine/tyrosine aminotransferase